MTARTLTNSLTPFAFPDTERGDVVLQLTLVGADHKTVIPVLSVDDAPMGAVQLRVEDMPDGVFSVDMQTNDTTTPETWYLVDMWQAGIEDGQRFHYQFVSQVLDGPGELQWSAFFAPSPPLEPGEWSAFLAHAQDQGGMIPAARHPSADQQAALDAAAAPNGTNPIATLADIAASGGGTAYEHIQASAAAQWTVAHNLGYFPSVELLDVGGAEFDAEVVHTTVNQFFVYLNAAAAGRARCV